jgi:hypothetical protein
MARSLSDNRARAPRFSSRSTAVTSSEGGKGKLLVFGLMFVSLSGGGWAWWHYRPDPQLAKIQAMRVDLEKLRDQPGMTDEQRRAQWEGFQQEIEKLTPEQRQVLREDRDRQREQYFDEQLRKHFALPPDQQRAKIDEQIDRMEEWQKEREKRRREREAGGGNRDRGRGGPPGGGNAHGGSGGGGRGGPGGPGGGGWRNASPEQRNNWRRDRLDSGNPESRGMRAEYRQQMKERREERGLPNNGRGWF